MRRVDLTETPQVRLARMMREQDARLGRLETRPTGIKHLGVDGDVVWDGPRFVEDPGNPGGPLIPSWDTWSVKEIPVITETLVRDLDEAGDRIQAARDELAGMQDVIAGVTVDITGLNASVGQAGEDAATAQAAAVQAEAAAGQAAADAAAALDAAQNASGKQQVYFGATAPAVGDPDVLWINNQGVPHQWVGTPPATGTWVEITDARIVAAAQAAQAAQGAASAAQAAAAAAAADALAAHQAADAADAKAGQALTSASGRNSRIISLNAPSGTVHPTTGLPLVTGDTWWRWDTTTARNVIGAWVWRDNGWRTETLTDSVLGSLDVNKLLVLGTARMTEAVVQKIMGDAAYFNLINVEDLTVTGTGTINELVAAKLAAAQIVFGVLRSEVDDVTHLYSIMDSYGYRVINNNGENGVPETVVALGPDGEMLLQLGVGDRKVNINSAGGITGHTGTFQELWVNGRPINGDVSLSAPRGNVSWGQMFGGGNPYSNWMTSRDMVLGLEADLERGRVYEIEMSTTTVETNDISCIPMLCLHYTLDGTFPGDSWDGSRVGESIIGFYQGFRSLPGLKRVIDLRNAGSNVFLRGAVSLARYAGSGQCRVAAPIQPCRIEVNDIGTRWTDRGRPLYGGQSGQGQAAKVRTVQRFRATGWRTYARGGGHIVTDKPTQGYWSSNRECIFMFDDMVGPTAGAIIHRATLSTIADHWNNNAGGTGRWHRHGHFGGFPASTAMVHMKDTSGWPRGARMSIDLNKPERDMIQNGTMRGFGFSSSSTAPEYYGKFSPNTNDDTTFIDIDMER